MKLNELLHKIGLPLRKMQHGQHSYIAAPAAAGFVAQMLGYDGKRDDDRAEAHAQYLTHCANVLPELVSALRRISHAKPDRLDHSLDILIIERAARIAEQALTKAENIN